MFPKDPCPAPPSPRASAKRSSRACGQITQERLLGEGPGNRLLHFVRRTGRRRAQKGDQTAQGGQDGGDSSRSGHGGGGAWTVQDVWEEKMR